MFLEVLSLFRAEPLLARIQAWPYAGPEPTCLIKSISMICKWQSISPLLMVWTGSLVHVRGIPTEVVWSKRSFTARKVSARCEYCAWLIFLLSIFFHIGSHAVDVMCLNSALLRVVTDPSALSVLQESLCNGNTRSWSSILWWDWDSGWRDGGVRRRECWIRNTGNSQHVWSFS